MATRTPHHARALTHQKQMQIDYLTGDGSDAPFPPEISHPGGGGKFAPDGTPLFFPGNTFVCHIDPTSTAHRALRKFSAEMQKGPANDYFTYLPDSSFHMTVFPALCGNPLGHDGWPSDLVPGTTLEEVNALYDERLKEKEAFETCHIKPVGTIAGTSVIVEGHTDADHTSLWTARRVLQNLTELTRKGFESYVFHVSICYRTRWMPADLAEQHLKFLQPLIGRLVETTPLIALGPIEFCHFENMHRFRLKSKIGENSN